MKRKINVSASGTLNLNPDAVIVSFSITENDEEYKRVHHRLNSRVKEFRKLVESLGFKRSDLISNRYVIEQNYEWDAEKERRYMDGFEGEHKLSIKFKLDHELLDKLLRTLYPALDGIPYTVQFDLMDREAYKYKVIDIAVKKAVGEAEQLAKSTGVKLGPIVKLNFGERNYGDSLFYGGMLSKSSRDDAHKDYVSPEFQPGVLQLSRTVYIEWRIVDE